MDRFSGRAQTVGVVDLEYAVLFDDAEEKKHPQGAPQAEGAARNPQREKSKRDAQWKREHDDERVRETFELGGQHHVHENGGEQHGEEQIPGSLFENFHLDRKSTRLNSSHGYISY